MTMNIGGNLADRLVGELISDIAKERKSGLLSLSKSDITKGLFFDEGLPVGSVSTLPDEQLETILIRDGHASSELLACAKLLCGQQQIGRYLAERELVAEQVISQLSKALSREIALSLFEWDEGEFTLDESVRYEGNRTFDCTAAALIVDGVRRCSSISGLLDRIAPNERVITSANSNTDSYASSANLNSAESYILSSITSPTRLSDVATNLGLAEGEARAALSVLLTLGLLRFDSANRDLSEAVSGVSGVKTQGDQTQTPEPAAAQTAEPAAEPEAREETPASLRRDQEQVAGPPETLDETISRQLQSLEEGDYYHMLGVDRDAPSEVIIRSHGELEQMFDFYKALYPDDVKLIDRLDALSEKIRRAKVTLTDPNLRLRYELADPNASTPHEVHENRKRDAVGETIDVRVLPPPLARIERSEKASVVASTARAVPLVQSIPRAPRKPAGVTIGMVATAPPAARPRQRRQGRPISAEQVAHHNYMQGRARYDQKDVHAAEHLFREAVRLNPNEPNHHYYLALTLLILSQAHHAHTHDKGCHVTCNLGGALVSNPRLRYEAAKHLEKAGELSPLNSSIPLRLGLLFKEANLSNKARLYFRRTLELDSKNEIALREISSGSTGPLEPIEGYEENDVVWESSSKSSRGRARG